MNKEHVKGTVKEIKGRVKEEVGYRTGNDELTGEGIVDRVKGKVQREYGNLKEVIKGRVDNILDGKPKKAV